MLTSVLEASSRSASSAMHGTTNPARSMAKGHANRNEVSGGKLVRREACVVAAERVLLFLSFFRPSDTKRSLIQLSLRMSDNENDDIRPRIEHDLRKLNGNYMTGSVSARAK